MKSSIAIRSTLASFYNSFGLISWKLRTYSQYNFLFLTYHRILSREKAGTQVQAGMYVEPETFETHIHFLERHLNIISISEFLSNFRKDFGTSSIRPFCILTFDDGWYDFYQYVFPILKTYQIPATVFLPTNFIGTTKCFWTDSLAKLFSQRQRAESKERRVRIKTFSSNYLTNQLENLKGSKESKLEKAMQILKAYRDEEIEEILSYLSRNWNLNPEPLDRSFLSWEEVREMAQSGLISFGSHTASHRILTTLTDTEIQGELVRSKERLILEKVVDPSFIPFSYPNGSYDEKIAKMVKEVGYNLAVNTEGGWNHLGSNPFTLRRIAIHQDMTSTEAMFGCRITNIF